MGKMEEDRELFTVSRDIVTEFLDNELNELISFGESGQSDFIIISDFLFGIKRDFNLFTLSQETEVEAIWDTIRKDESLTKFILNMSNELQLSIGSENHKELRKLICSSYGSLSSDSSSIDDTALDKLPIEEELQYLLESNVWLVPIYMINHSSLDAILEMVKRFK